MMFFFLLGCLSFVQHTTMIYYLVRFSSNKITEFWYKTQHPTPSECLIILLTLSLTDSKLDFMLYFTATYELKIKDDMAMAFCNFYNTVYCFTTKFSKLKPQHTFSYVFSSWDIFYPYCFQLIQKMFTAFPKSKTEPD